MNIRTIEVLTELIIPRDDTPGASDAGVSEFIDFMAAHGEEELQPMRPGLQWLEARARALRAQALQIFRRSTGSSTGRHRAKRRQSHNDTGRKFFLLIRK